MSQFEMVNDETFSLKIILPETPLLSSAPLTSSTSMILNRGVKTLFIAGMTSFIFLTTPISGNNTALPSLGPVVTSTSGNTVNTVEPRRPTVAKEVITIEGSYGFLTQVVSKPPNPTYIIPKAISIAGDGVQEDGTDMTELLDKLLKKRNQVERNGVIIGTALGFGTLLTPIVLPSINWTSVLPASLLGFSLIIFVYLRKKIRG